MAQLAVPFRVFLVARTVRRVPQLSTAITILVSALILPLLGVLIIGSLRPAKALPFDDVGLTLANYIEVLSDPFAHRLFVNTLLYAGASLSVSLSITIAIVWLVERTTIPFKGFIHVSMFVPLIMPGALTAFGWVLLLSPRQGFINVALRDLLGFDGRTGPLDIYTFAGMVFLTGTGIVPSMFIMLSAAFRNMDSQLEEAGRASGASPAAVTRQVTLPILLPSITGAAIYYTILLIELFEIPLVIGFNADFLVISTYIYRQVFSESGVPGYGTAATFGSLALVLGIALAYLYARLTRATYKFVVVTGRRTTPHLIRLGAVGKIMGLVFIGCFLMVTSIMPVIALLWTSLFATWTFPSVAALEHVSLDVYRTVLLDPRWTRAIRSTVILVLAASTGTVLLATLISWVVVRDKGRWVRWLDMIAFLPRTIPGIVIALAIFLTFLRTPLYGTIAILVLAHIINYMPFAVRSIHATLLQLDPELEEAARTSGAGTLATFSLIVLPLLRPALLNSWLWVAAHSVRDFTYPLMLATTGNIVVSQLLWQVWERGFLERASAMAVMLILSLIILALPARYMSTRNEVS
jgi:iron(III) transport system permease protein